MGFSRKTAAGWTCAAVLFAATLVQSSDAWAVSVNGVRVGEHPDMTRIVLDLSGSAPYQYSLSPDRRQVYVDLYDAQWNANTARSFAKSHYISGYHFQGGRLTIEANQPVTVAKAAALGPKGSRGNRLFLDLTRAPEYFTAASQMQPQPQMQPMPPTEPLPPTPMADEEPTIDQQAAEMPPPEGGYTRTGTNNMYFRFDAGYGFSGDADIQTTGMSGSLNDLGDSPVVDLGLGYQFTEGFRSDLTIGYAGWHELDDSNAGTKYNADVSSLYMLVSGYFDFRSLGSNWAPYMGAGIGAAYNKIGDMTRDGGATTVRGDESTGFAWQLAAGVGYDINPDLTLDLGYRFLNAGEISTDSQDTAGAAVTSFSGDMVDHQAMLGLRFKF